MAVVPEDKKEYIMETYGLTEKQIDDFLPSELRKHCEAVIQKRIDARGMIRTDAEPEKNSGSGENL